MQTNRDLPKDFWQPEKFDWAEEKEDEIRKNETASASLAPSTHFDWADDAEEEFLKNEASLTTSNHCNLAEDAEEEFLKNEAVATLLTPSIHFDWAEDKEEEIFKNEVALLSSFFGCFSEETHFNDDTPDTSSDEILTFSCGRTARSWEYMQEEADDEFGSRNEYIHYVGNPHHFNWQGKPVMERSSTRPEESLAVMLAKPKIPRLIPDSPDADDWVDRIQAIVCIAFRTRFGDHAITETLPFFPSGKSTGIDEPIANHDARLQVGAYVPDIQVVVFFHHFVTIYHPPAMTSIILQHMAF